MKIDKIIPCVCCDHEPSVEDSCYYGMPQIKVYTTKLSGNTYFSAFCPKCGRGGVSDFKTVNAALKEWNILQKTLYKWKNKKGENQDEDTNIY